ncbi:MAG: hypothetical protein ACI9ZM_003210 [Paracoccaceae bacterium]
MIRFPASKPRGPPLSVVFTLWLSMMPAEGLLAHELQQLRTRQLAPEYNRPVRSGAVRLEHARGQIQADDVNLVHGRSPS